MKRVLDFLKSNPVFQFATVEGDQPRCRPFGFHMVVDDKLYFCTGEGKKVWHQLKANPKFELSVSTANGEWLRLAGTAVFDSRPELVEKAFEVMPDLKHIYGPGKGATMAVFYVSEGQATLADMQGRNENFSI
ncbi:MAG: pyridoxamine 5'-phosphate oxidase family protein [Planctomycetaceae bacterium]|nr:pyridoxamine 5'-phosphate oxidase family protein [Planctomycetaceae bacterium]